MNHLEEISKEIINNPQLMLDETFLTMSLSLSHDLPLVSNKTLGKSKKNQQLISSSSSYGDSINFDFSKKNYGDGGLKAMIQEENSEEEIEEEPGSKIIHAEEDSLEEYEADFESYEEDREMDIREQERQSVK